MGGGKFWQREVYIASSKDSPSGKSMCRNEILVRGIGREKNLLCVYCKHKK
jgi:hypothetical protein